MATAAGDAEQAPTTYVGEDALGELASVLHGQGVRSILILTDGARRFVDQVSSALPGIELHVFDEAQVHVPEAVVDRARNTVRTHRPEVLVSLGGGSATGLGKALRLELDLPFYAIPTTFAGSEMTTIFGITRVHDKRTGRDPRVRPDAVYYVPRFFRHLPLPLKTKSLFNALAHPVSALSTHSMDAAEAAGAEGAIRLVVGALKDLGEDPADVKAHARALDGAARCGRILQGAQLGRHHHVAHRLGGRFRLEHAGLHAVLLPQSILRISEEDPAVAQRLEAAANTPSLPRALFDLLAAVRAETSLEALGMSDLSGAENLDSLDEGDLRVVRRAFHGERPILASKGPEL